MQAQTHVKKISVSRLDFMRGLGAAGVAGVLDALPTVAAETPDDWKAAFVQAGFDPSAPGCATFINLCGGHDGAIEPGQRAWLAAEAASIPKDRTVFLMAHYPNVGVGRVDGYDIGVVIRTFFSNRSADTWLLAGHNHRDEIRRHSLPGGGRLYVATHVREPFGYWIYGLQDGRLVARVLVPFDGKTGRTRQAAERGLVGEAVQDGGPLLLPFEQEGEKLLWRQFLGQAGDERCRVSVEDSQADAGSYFFYVRTVVYRLPLKEARGDAALYVRIGGFGFGCNSSLAGFALLA